jgi:hypothetical protein
MAKDDGRLVIMQKSLNLKRKGRVVVTFIKLPAALDPADLDLESLLMEGVLPTITPPP